MTPAPVTRRRFLADLMLMRLGRWLRLMGQDVALPKGESDSELLSQAASEGRTVLTRDRGLFGAAVRTGTQCRLINSSGIRDQLLEMERAGVPLRLDPQRCTICNAILEEIHGTADERRMWRCTECRKSYWIGGHWKKIEETLEELRLASHAREGEGVREEDRSRS